MLYVLSELERCLHWKKRKERHWGFFKGFSLFSHLDLAVWFNNWLHGSLLLLCYMTNWSEWLKSVHDRRWQIVRPISIFFWKGLLFSKLFPKTVSRSVSFSQVIADTILTYKFSYAHTIIRHNSFIIYLPSLDKKNTSPNPLYNIWFFIINNNEIRKRTK